MAECPTGEYAAEIVTPGGLTVASPTEDRSGTLGGALDWSGSEYKFADWNQLTVTLMGRLELAWTKYKSWPATAKVPVDTYNGLVDRLNAIRDRYARVRKPWRMEGSAFDAFGSGGWNWGIVLPDIAFDATDEIGALVAICVDAQCLRQEIDKTLADAGGEPATPGAGHDPADKRGGLGVVGTVAAITVATAFIGGIVLAGRKLSARS